MTEFTEQLNVIMTEEQHDRIKKRVKESDYNSKAEYIRSMIKAGESNIAALDPRTNDTDSSSQASHDTAEAAARSLSDTAIIDQLPNGEDNKISSSDVLEEPRKNFTEVFGSRLKQLAEKESSPVESDFQGNYWREVDQ